MLPSFDFFQFVKKLRIYYIAISKLLHFCYGTNLDVRGLGTASNLLFITIIMNH